MQAIEYINCETLDVFNVRLQLWMVLAQGKISYNIYVQTLYEAANIISIKYLPLCKRYISHHEFNIDDYEKLREW